MESKTYLFLPASHVLHRRHIEPIANCELCGSGEETIGHVLIDCTVASLLGTDQRDGGC